VLVADVNVLLYAHRPESERHQEYLDWLQQALRGPEPFGVSEAVLASFVRIATHHRVYVEPSPSEIALAFCDAVRSAPAAVVVRPGEDHWTLFSQLVLTAGARGNLVPDAYLAALAIEQGATFVTTDRGFARYPGLRRAHPLE
jgi:toxin-antitoxin system PIN domain toxin